MPRWSCVEIKPGCCFMKAASEAQASWSCSASWGSTVKVLIRMTGPICCWCSICSKSDTCLSISTSCGIYPSYRDSRGYRRRRSRCPCLAVASTWTHPPRRPPCSGSSCSIRRLLETTCFGCELEGQARVFHHAVQRHELRRDYLPHRYLLCVPRHSHHLLRAYGNSLENHNRFEFF